MLKKLIYTFRKKTDNFLDYISDKIQFKYRTLFIFCLLAIPCAGLLIVFIHGPETKNEAFSSLDAIAKLKAGQIENWLGERKSDGHIFFTGQKFIQSAIRLQKGDHSQEAYLKKELEHIRETYDYDSVILLNSKGVPVLSLGDHFQIDNITKEMLPDAFETEAIVINQIQFDESSHESFLDIIFPLLTLTTRKPAGAVVFHIHPDHFLFPYIQNWPVSSKTGETLLVRREGNDIIFLNNLRFQDMQWPKKKVSLLRTDLPAVIAVLDGKAGRTEGVDYRNHRVLAAYHPVRGTDWFVLAKIDRKEAYAALMNLVLWVSMVSIIAVALIGIIIFILYKQQKIIIHMEAESQALKLKSDLLGRVSALTKSSPDAMIISNDKGVIMDWNAGAEKIFGYNAEEVIGSNIHMLMPEEFHERHEKGFMNLLQGGKPKIIGSIVEFAGLRKNGEEFPLELSLAQWKSEGSHFFSAIIRDISVRKISEQKIYRLTQLYSALSQCNEAIVRSTCKNDLYQKICRNVVDLGGMKMAWIGELDQACNEIIKVASYGDVSGYLESSDFEQMRKNLFISSYSPEIDFSKPFFFQDIQNEGMPLHQSMAKKAGFFSSASFPVVLNNNIVGMLNVYSELKNAFDTDITHLLNELVMDIGYAISNFESQAQRAKTMETLAESEQRFRRIIEQPLVAVGILQNGEFVYVNPLCVEILGFTFPEELIGTSFISLVIEMDRERVQKEILKNFSSGADFRVLRKDKQPINVGVHGSSTSYNGKEAIIITLKDITEKKRAEEKIESYINQLQNAFIHTVEVVNTMSEMRDPYTAGHERRVADLAVAIGKEMGFDERKLEGLKISGWLHDLGKITIPAEMLAKPRKLTEAEYSLVKEHPQTGFDILKQVEFPWPVASVVLQHHERIDGSGYPFGLKGDEILMEAKIMAVADVVEAMASHRPYRPGLGLQKALEEIRTGKGIVFDKEVAQVCLAMFANNTFSLPEL